MKEKALKIVNVPITEVIPYWRNPRDNDEAVQKAIESIKRYGFRQPLNIDQNNVIITGHTRYKALLILGWKHAPCVIIDDLSEQQIKEYRIADNKVSEFSTWNMPNLTLELKEIENLEHFKEFFKEDIDRILNDSLGMSYEAKDEKDIEEANNRLDNQFSNENILKNEDMVELICPECTASFLMKRSDLVLKESINKVN